MHSVHEYLFFVRFGKFSAIISSNTFSIPFSYSSFSGIHVTHRLACFCYHIGLVLLLFILIWLSVCYPNWVISIILSSRPFILSFMLSILLFIAFSSVFLSANEFANFSWFLSIFFSSFLKYFAFMLIAFLDSFSIFIISFWKLVSIRMKMSVSLFFQGNSRDLLSGSGSFAS